MSNLSDIRDATGGITLLPLGGKNRRLKFDLNSFAELEDLFGGVEEAMKALEGGSIKALRAIVWSGLLHENTDEKGQPTISQAQVGSWIDIKDLPTFSEKLGKALAEALPKEKIEEGDAKINQGPKVPFDQATKAAE